MQITRALVLSVGLLFASSPFLTACGKKGPLYLPQQDTTAQGEQVPQKPAP